MSVNLFSSLICWHNHHLLKMCDSKFSLFVVNWLNLYTFSVLVQDKKNVEKRLVIHLTSVWIKMLVLCKTFACDWGYLAWQVKSLIDADRVASLCIITPPVSRWYEAFVRNSLYKCPPLYCLYASNLFKNPRLNQKEQYWSNKRIYLSFVLNHFLTVFIT